MKNFYLGRFNYNFAVIKWSSLQLILLSDFSTQKRNKIG